jgi:hypothetical protein
MSLISDALKKTQRMRTGEPVDVPAGNMPASRPGRHGTSGPTLVWVVAGAIVLVCAAVVTTVFLVRPAAAPALAQAKSAPAPAAANTAAPPAVLAPVVIPSGPKPADAAPVVKTEAARPAPTPAAAPVVSEAAVTPPALATSAPAKIPPLSSAPRTAGASRQPPTVATAVPAGVAAQPDPRIQAFIDSIKVAGIRSSGTDSKVLMNDKVYRVNDIVDRSLNLRLIEVQADSLTFVDENGVVYTKDHF